MKTLTQNITNIYGKQDEEWIANLPSTIDALARQAIPGTTLKALYPTQAEYVMNSYVDTIKKLHSKHLPSKHSYQHIGEWLSAIIFLIPY